MGAVVCQNRQPRPGYWLDEFLAARDRILWSRDSLDHHRLDAVLQKVEVTTQEGSYTKGTMGVHKTGLVLAFYYRVAIDLGIPSHR